jgi:hypothetical protein
VIKDNTNLVYADSTESILGIKIDMNIHKVATISHRKLDILKYDYAIKGNREDLEGIHVGRYRWINYIWICDF